MVRDGGSPSRFVCDGALRFETHRTPELEATIVRCIRINRDTRPTALSSGSMEHLDHHGSAEAMTARTWQQYEVHPTALAFSCYMQLCKPEGATAAQHQEALHLRVTQAQILPPNLIIGKPVIATPPEKRRIIKQPPQHRKILRGSAFQRHPRLRAHKSQPVTTR